MGVTNISISSPHGIARGALDGKKASEPLPRGLMSNPRGLGWGGSSVHTIRISCAWIVTPACTCANAISEPEVPVALK
jgi:hypothetical protein